MKRKRMVPIRFQDHHEDLPTPAKVKVPSSSSSCVFCLKPTTLESNKSSKRPSRLLDPELKAIFVIRKLLDIPQRLTADILERFGNPSTWINICWACEDLVSEAKSIHDRILKLEESLRGLKDDARKKVKESQKKKAGRLELKEAAGEVRNAILNNNCGYASLSEVEVDYIQSTELCEDDAESVAIEVKSEGVVVVEENVEFFSEDQFLADDYSPVASDGGNAEIVAGGDDDAQDEWLTGTPSPAKRSRLSGSSAQPPSAGRSKKTTDIKFLEGNGIQRDENGDVIVHKCHLCPFSNPRKFNLYRHIRGIHGQLSDDMKVKDTGGRCQVCLVLFPTLGELNDHKISAHKFEKCPLCDQLFMNKAKLRAHDRRHHFGDPQQDDPNDVQEENGKSNNDFSDSQEFCEEDNPEQNQDEEAEIFSCTWCSYETDKGFNLKRHLRTVHWEYDEKSTASQKRKCQKCNQLFDTMRAYTEHFIQFHDYHKCSKCPRFFSDKGGLKFHISRNHADAKTPNPSEDGDANDQEPHESGQFAFTCDQCGCERVSKKDMELHIRARHWKIPKIPNGTNLSGLTLNCTICNENFSGGEDLRSHCIQEHKLLECSSASCHHLLFPTKCRLDLHFQRRHAVASRPYRCTYCPSRFKNSSMLKGHLRLSHWAFAAAAGSKKSRKCGHCDKPFADFKLFRKHSIEFHGLLECSQCPRLFDTQLKLDSHVAIGHNRINSKTFYRDKNSKGKKQIENVEEEVDLDSIEIEECPYCTYCAPASCKRRLLEHQTTLHYESFARDRMAKGDQIILKCDKCVVTSFVSVDELILHKLEVHNMRKCEDCLHMAPSAGYIQRHREKYHSDNRAEWMERIKNRLMRARQRLQRNPDEKALVKNRCKTCERNFESKQELINHNISVHPERIFSCDQCPPTTTQYFEAVGKLYAHKVSVHNEPSDPYKCHHCDYVSRNYRQVYRHTQVMHMGLPKIICEVCSKEYSCETTLKWHKIQVHGLDKESNAKFNLLQCKFCMKFFSNPYYLRAHERMKHFEKSFYKCTYDGCAANFNGRKQLDFHISTVHKKEYKYCCEICGKKSATRLNLQHHMGRVHGPKDKKCPYCDFATNEDKFLQRHVEVHENAETRPYQCNYCGKGFPAYRYLTQHFNSHIRRGEMTLADRPSYTDYKLKLEIMHEEMEQRQLREDG